MRAALLALLAASSARASEGGPLRLFEGDELKAQLGPEELAAKVGAREVALKTEFFDHPKRYRAVPLAALLDAVYGAAWRGSAGSELAFVAADGYEAVVSAGRLAEPGALLAFRDLDDPAWEPTAKKKAAPGPYFLVWEGPGQSAAKGYPWPWAVVSVKLVAFDAEYAKVIPKAPEGSAAYRGFRTFKARCLRCHAIEGQGGKYGPDLGGPRNITEYRSDAFLKAFIRAPSSFRHSNMPDHPELTDRDLDELLAYLKRKAREKAKAP